MAAIHRLAPDHDSLGFDREWSQRPHIDDYPKWGLLPCQNLLTIFVPLIEFIFRHIASEGEIKSQIGLFDFIHSSTHFHVRPSESESPCLFVSSTTLRTELQHHPASPRYS